MHPAMVALLTLVLAVAAGCGDAGGPGASSADPSATTPGGTDPTPPTTRIELDRTLRVPDGPDWLAEGFGSLWVKRDNGAVRRVSSSGEVLADVDADIFEQPVCQGIGVTATAVWACATSGTLVRIDPANHELTTVDVPKVNEQGRLTSSEGLLWVLTGDGDRLEGLADDGEVEKTVELGTYCNETADTADAAVLWVACAYEGLVLRVDLAAGEVTGRVDELPQARSVAVAGDVWVGHEGGLARIDPAGPEVVDNVDLAVDGLRAADGGVWVRGVRGSFLTFVDAGTGRPTTRLAAPEVRSVGDVIEVGGRLWATAAEDDLLVRVAR